MVSGGGGGGAVVDGGKGTHSWCKPSRWCLKRCMGSRAMANDAMDVQGAKLVWEGGGWRRLFLYLCLCVVCVDGFYVCNKMLSVYLQRSQKFTDRQRSICITDKFICKCKYR
jgi:hypothetical protein